MASTYSFDVVSDFDRQELVNTLDRVRRDVETATTSRIPGRRSSSRRRKW